MATKLTKAVRRETTKNVGGRPVIITIAPAGSQNETLVSLRLLGKRTQYVIALSDIYRIAAVNHGLKEARAKREACRSGIPWRVARRKFISDNTI